MLSLNDLLKPLPEPVQMVCSVLGSGNNTLGHLEEEMVDGQEPSVFGCCCLFPHASAIRNFPRTVLRSVVGTNLVSYGLVQ